MNGEDISLSNLIFSAVISDEGMCRDWNTLLQIFIDENSFPSKQEIIWDHLSRLQRFLIFHIVFLSYVSKSKPILIKSRA